jgi:hypothetical protein
LPDEKNPSPNPRKPHRIRIRLTQNLFLYYRKSAQRQADAGHHEKSKARQFYEKTKDETWKRPVEAIGVLVVAFYTLFAGYQSCEMRHANRIAVAHEAKELQAYVTLIEMRMPAEQFAPGRIAKPPKMRGRLDDVGTEYRCKYASPSAGMA